MAPRIRNVSNNSKLNGQHFWEANKFDMPNLYRIYKQSGAVQLSSGSIKFVQPDKASL